MAPEETEIEVEVAYALPERQFLKRLRVPAGTTAAEAVQRSGVLEEIGIAVPEKLSLGIFGKELEAPQHHVLGQGDRVEIYRALVAGPREARRRRARAR